MHPADLRAGKVDRVPRVLRVDLRPGAPPRERRSGISPCTWRGADSIVMGRTSSSRWLVADRSSNAAPPSVIRFAFDYSVAGSSRVPRALPWADCGALAGRGDGNNATSRLAHRALGRIRPGHARLEHSSVINHRRKRPAPQVQHDIGAESRPPSGDRDLFGESVARYQLEGPVESELLGMA